MRTTLKEINLKENTSFGAIHLKVSSLEKATIFWCNIAGLKVRKSSASSIAFGSENKTLVVVNKSAEKPYVKGYSGLYHFAIHVPDESELASVINRLNQRAYPYSPIDHTISKAVYLEDMEGITLEFTLETPHREVLGDKGTSSGPQPLGVRIIMQSLKNDNIEKIIDSKCFIGHIHLYANNVEQSNEFYKRIGFKQNKYEPQMVFADLGAGGEFGHRIALNSWHGFNKPLAPNNIAGLDYFQLTYRDKGQLELIIYDLGVFKKTPSGYWVQDPTGNKILLN